MDRDRLREEVREALTARLKIAAPPAEARPAASAAPPADVLSWRRFDDRTARRPLVTEADVMRARGGARTLAVPKDALVTPLARETAGRLGVRLEEGSGGATHAEAHAGREAEARAATGGPRKAVALAADHGGFALKEALKPFVAGLGFEVADLGTKDATPVDYPDFAHAVAGAVTSGKAAFGIVVDGVGVGSAMAVNRHAGARAAPCSTTLQARSAREHNDANVLTLGGRHLGEDVAKAIVKEFLEAPFAGGRHEPRVRKIEVGR
jgi:ribose 5-phosphate isomerase B